MKFKDLYKDILNRNFSNLTKYLKLVYDKVDELKSYKPSDIMKSTKLKDELSMIIEITNIIYNETTFDPIIPDDDYDDLVEIYKVVFGRTPIGSTLSISDIDENYDSSNSDGVFKDIYYDIDKDKYYFYDAFFNNEQVLYRRGHKIDYTEVNQSDSQTSTAEQLYPDLVGTLSKCKYVLDKDKVENNDTTFEYDFIHKHMKNGLYSATRKIKAMLQLKFDGMSVVAKVIGNKIVEARSRGDVSNSLALDLTNILYGYTFDNCPEDIGEVGVKFEAIMTYSDLERFNTITGSNYKNARTAVASILGRKDGRRFQNYITLVPIDMTYEGMTLSPEDTVYVCNKLYANTVRCETIILEGDYLEILYSVNRYLKEAEELRPYIPYLYDGIVFKYLDKDLIERLGRSDSIDHWQTAIKFRSFKKITKFIKYEYTIGKDGRITPIAYYEPVKFLNTTHTKCTIHSYKRFKELNLAKGDHVEITYRNDVMPYIDRASIPNSHSGNPQEEFIQNCPYCNSPIELTTSGKTAYCTNIHCSGRAVRRIAGFFEALNIKGFSDRYLEKLKVRSIKELYELDEAIIEERLNSSIMAMKLRSAFINGINNRYDYELFGALGFTSIGSLKWKLIFKYINPKDILKMTKSELLSKIVAIKGVGELTASTIVNELDMFEEDIRFILTLNYRHIDSSIKTKSVRFSGIRPTDMESELIEAGFDVNFNSGVTKDTDILVIPHEGFNSSKVSKAEKYGVQIVPISEFRKNYKKYL